MSQQEKDKQGYREATDLVKQTSLETCQEISRSFAVWATLKAYGQQGHGLV